MPALAWERELLYSKVNVLIVDDDHDGADSLAGLLERLVSPLHVRRAYNGSEAVVIATDSSERPDVIVTDIEMPHMNGVEAAINIREVLGSSAPLIIAITGNPAIASNSGQCNVFDHVLMKPVEIDLLVALLRS